MSIIYHTAGFRVYPNLYTLESNDDSVTVRPRTFSVLLRLLSQAGEVVAKETLLNEVWDDVRCSG